MTQRRLAWVGLGIAVAGVVISLIGVFGPPARTHTGDRLVEFGTGLAFIGVAITFIANRKAR